MIPRRFIRTVPEQTTSDVERYWQTFVQHHPGWEMMTLRDPIDERRFPFTSPHWPRCTTGAQRAGLVRLEALWQWGGIYVDSDVECFRSWEALRGAEIFAAWEDANVMPDAVIGARAAHLLIYSCMQAAIDRIDGGAWESGPGVSTEILGAAEAEVLQLPPGAFYPVHYTRKDEIPQYLPEPWVFGLHHWHASWVPTERKRRRK